MTKRDWRRWAFSVTLWGLVLTVLIVALSSVERENCWDKYQTEDEAIMNCESHE